MSPLGDPQHRPTPDSAQQLRDWLHAHYLLPSLLRPEDDDRLDAGQLHLLLAGRSGELDASIRAQFADRFRARADAEIRAAGHEPTDELRDVVYRAAASPTARCDPVRLLLERGATPRLLLVRLASIRELVAADPGLIGYGDDVVEARRDTLVAILHAHGAPDDRTVRRIAFELVDGGPMDWGEPKDDIHFDVLVYDDPARYAVPAGGALRVDWQDARLGLMGARSGVHWETTLSGPLSAVLTAERHALIDAVQPGATWTKTQGEAIVAGFRASATRLAAGVV